MEKIYFNCSWKEQEDHDEKINLLKQELNDHLIDLRFLFLSILIQKFNLLLLFLSLLKIVKVMQSKCKCRVEELDKEQSQVKYRHIKIKYSKPDQVLICCDIRTKQSRNVKHIRNQEYDKQHRQVYDSWKWEEQMLVLEDQWVRQPYEDAHTLKRVVSRHLEEPYKPVDKEMRVWVLHQRPGIMQEPV